MANHNKHYVVLVAVVAAIGGLLFGYDTAVISGGIGFLRAHFNLGAAEMGWAASSALAGCIIGAAIAGVISDATGRRKALLISAVLFTVSGIGTALPRTLTEFVIARMLGGVGIGMASLLSPLYIAEISPAAIRGRLVSYNQFAIVTGMLVVYFINYIIASQGSEDWNVNLGWRWMFGSETLPAFLFFLLLLFVPESPRWLMKQGRRDEAYDVLRRAGGEGHAEGESVSIEETLQRESGSLAQLFQPGMRRVLVIGIVLAILQQVTGINVFLYYGPEIFKQLGAGTNAALLQTAVIGATNLAATVVAIRTVDRLGRKPLMIYGISGMGVCLFMTSIAASYQNAAIWVLLFIIGYAGSFALSVGPVTWVILSEIFPTRIRGRAMAIATLLLWAANYLVAQTFPILNENEWLIAKFNHAFPFWLYCFMCVVQILFVWRFVPETKGKTLEEIERLWAQGRLNTSA
jgi:SP family xylose:H+ symportor-like MFS transporter